MRLWACLGLSLLLPLALAACNFPQDPEETLDKVRGGELVVGVNGSSKADPAAGLENPRERAILTRFAERLDARIVLRHDEFHQLAAALEEGEVDLIAGDLPETTPFATRLGLSRPMSETRLRGETVKTVFAVRKGENRFLSLLETVAGEVK
ncbi:ABC transporter substrate-binding protein [Roseibium aestuarii]|uniref:Extracellular solute-binding protein (Family 3) n=1 Tax=Roseibium aestuarii TaxID=2600299 RepID=A0ABW4JVS0_9HYPH|nr:ABC transporter substrate-binding protein [Roseibium aestuarii]